MSKVTLTITDEVNCKFTGLDIKVRREIMDALTLIDPKARYTPMGRMGRWDGKVQYMQMGGSTYINLLDKIIPILEKHKIDVEIDDQRIKHDLTFTPIDANLFDDVVFPTGHHMEGKKIVLRDHQVNAVNTLLENPHGLLLASTSSGKAQPLDEPVLTPEGWRRMGDLAVGDKVLTPDGKSASILGIFPKGIKKVVQMNIEDNRHAYCCDEHLWDVIIDGERYTLEVLDIIEKLKSTEVYIPVLKELEPQAQCTKPELQAVIRDIKKGVLGSFPINLMSMNTDIKRYVINELFDKSEFKSEDMLLVHNIRSLIYSTGGTCKFKFKDDAYIIYDLRMDISVLKIESIEYVDDQECQCIYIDHPDHLYITRDYLVTHNTLICAAISKKVQEYGKSIVIVPSVDLVQQTYNDYEMVGLDAGVFYGKKKEFGHQHTITTWQSFNSLWKKTKRDEIELTEQDIHDMMDGVIAVIVDEAHNSSSSVLTSVLQGIMRNVPLRWGMTGTIPKDPILARTIQCNLGSVVLQITAKELQDKGILSTCNITSIKLKCPLKFKTYHEELKYLTTDKTRMKYISTLIDALSHTGNTLVLVDRIEAGELLCEYLGLPNENFVRGETKKKDRESQYGEIRWTDNKILIATYGVASTGISISRLYNVVLIEPGKSFIRTIQSIGRGLRKAEDKDHVEIIDINGSNKFSARHARERIGYYKEVQYPYEIIEIKDWKEQ